MAIAIRRETFATWMFPLVLVLLGGSRTPSLIDSLNPSLAPPSTELDFSRAFSGAPRTATGHCRCPRDRLCAVVCASAEDA